MIQYNEVGARTLVAPPAVEPFTAAEVKATHRISIATEDAIITRAIKTAREEAENYLRRALITQTWKVHFERFPSDFERSLELPYPPLQSVTHLKYLDSDGVLTTMNSTTDYEVKTNTGLGKICLLPDIQWPVTQVQRSQAVEVQFVCGYGTAGSNIPSPILDAMMLRIGDLYENKENWIVGSIVTPIPRGFYEMLGEYSCQRFF